MNSKYWPCLYLLPTRASQLIAFSLLVLMMSGCATSIDPVTGKGTSNSFTLEEDIQIGKKLLETNIKQMQSENVAVNEDENMTVNLEAMAKRIAAVSDLPDLPYTVSLFQCDIINAAAAPGGAIMVYEGLFSPPQGLVKTNEELAAVLAHEIAHVNCRHSTEEMTSAKTTEGLGVALSMALGVAVGVASGDANLGLVANDVTSDIYSAGTMLWFPSYNRDQEYEADRLSLTYLGKARINPKAALEIWKRAAKESKNEKSSIFASHPNDADRFKQLEEFLPEAMELYEQAGGTPHRHKQVAPLR